MDLERIMIDAWWGLLVQGRAKDVRVLVEAALPRTAKNDLSSFVFVDGTKGWCGVFCTIRQDPREQLADALRDPRRREVILLNFGGDSDWVDDPYIGRWNGTEWKREYNRVPWKFAEWLGIDVTVPKRHRRPYRTAALAEGVSLQRAEGLAQEPTQMLVVDRGILILGDPCLASALSDVATWMCEVTHFLDDNTFDCTIYRAGHIQEFRPSDPTDRGTGAERIFSVDGETDPRVIVRKLGIPEDYIFPASYD
jgi:hypothetical protein